MYPNYVKDLFGAFRGFLLIECLSHVDRPLPTDIARPLEAAANKQLSALLELKRTIVGCSGDVSIDYELDLAIDELKATNAFPLSDLEMLNAIYSLNLTLPNPTTPELRLATSTRIGELVRTLLNVRAGCYTHSSKSRLTDLQEFVGAMQEAIHKMVLSRSEVEKIVGSTMLEWVNQVRTSGSDNTLFVGAMQVCTEVTAMTWRSESQ